MKDNKTPNIQKKQQIRKHKRHKKRFYPTLRSLIGGMIFSVICITMFLVYYKVFDLKTVYTVGMENYYSGEQILEVSGLSRGGSTLSIDRKSVENKLSKFLPYVEKCEIVMKYPDEVYLYLTPAEPVAAIECNKKYYSVNQSGKILEVYDSKPINLPIVFGYELSVFNPAEYIRSADSIKETIFQELIDGIINENYKNVKTINMNERTDITIDYDERVVIKLGSSYDLTYKMKVIKAVINKSDTEAFKGVIQYNSEKSGVSVIPEYSGKPSILDSAGINAERRAEAQKPEEQSSQTQIDEESTG